MTSGLPRFLLEHPLNRVVDRSQVVGKGAAALRRKLDADELADLVELLAQ